MKIQDKTSAKAAMRGFIGAHFDEQVGVLARLVQCPFDDPTGRCLRRAFASCQAPTVGK